MFIDCENDQFSKEMNYDDNLKFGWRDQIVRLATLLFTLNIFQDFVFTYFKLERQLLCNYRLSKLLLDVTKLKTNAECLFFTDEISPLHMLVKKVLPKHSMVIFALVYS